jgi:Spy/CpxP family protein refolding chaperone
MRNIIVRSVLAIGAAGSLGLGAAAFAQSAGPSTPPPTPPAAQVPDGRMSRPRGEGRALGRQALRHGRMRRLARRLHLTEQQRTAARHLHAKTMAEVWAARADDTLTREQKIERIKAALHSGRSDFENLLTPEQHAKLDEIKTRRENRLLGL